MAKVTMPQLGESVAEGTIGKWLKQPGDHVAKYEPLLEVITDKVNAEVPSPFEGTLREILAEEGATVPNDAEIAIIDTADEASAPAAATGRRRGVAGDSASRLPSPRMARPARTSAPVAAAPPGARRRAAPAPAAAPAPEPAAARPAAVASPPTATGDAEARMTPAVRRLLREHDLSPAQITGTGGGGRITREDVLAVVESMRTGARPRPPPPRAPRLRGNRSRSPSPPRRRPRRRRDRLPRRRRRSSCCR